MKITTFNKCKWMWSGAGILVRNNSIFSIPRQSRKALHLNAFIEFSEVQCVIDDTVFRKNLCKLPFHLIRFLCRSSHVRCHRITHIKIPSPERLREMFHSTTLMPAFVQCEIALEFILSIETLNKRARHVFT